MSKRFYRLEEIIGSRKKGIAPIIPVSRASWYAGIKEGRYPRPFRLSERSTAWLSTDIEALIAKITVGVQERGGCEMTGSRVMGTKNEGGRCGNE